MAVASPSAHAALLAWLDIAPLTCDELAALAAIIGGSLFVLRRALRFRRWLQQMSPAQRIYYAMVWLAWCCGFRVCMGDTASEFGERLATTLPQVTADVQQIIDAYAAERWGGIAAPREHVTQA